jgi:hypothetical protein
MTIEHREHARQTGARSVLALRQQRRTPAKIPERSRLVVEVERQADGDARAARP